MYGCRICSLTLKKEYRLKKSDIHTGFGGKTLEERDHIE